MSGRAEPTPPAKAPEPKKPPPKGLEKAAEIVQRVADRRGECACLLSCPLHEAAPEMLAALEEINRDGFGSRFYMGTPRLLELINRAKGAKA